MEKLIYCIYRRVGFTYNKNVYASVYYSGGIVVVYLILLLVELFKELQKVKWAQVYGTIFISLTNKCYCQGQKMDLMKLASTQQI